MVLFNGCKINLGLDIISRRRDGFHDIETVMFPLRTPCDSVETVPAERLLFSCSGLAVDCPTEKNLVLRAARLLNINNVHIHLHKAIPFGAGLGGGSSDAAAALVLLNKVFELNLSTTQLETLAAQLGSDVPFFIRSAPQLCSGRGEIMTPINLSLAGYTVVIVKPSFSISTAQAYADATPELPSTPLSERISLPIEQWKTHLTNDFEKSLFANYPRLAEIKKQLYGIGAIYASMSGSGSAMFGLFPSNCVASSKLLNSNFDDCLVYCTFAD